VTREVPGGDRGGAISLCQFPSTSTRIDTDKTEPRDRSATKSSPIRTNPTGTNPTRTTEPTKQKSPVATHTRTMSRLITAHALGTTNPQFEAKSVPG
jgi:hypothetical protein